MLVSSKAVISIPRMGLVLCWSTATRMGHQHKHQIAAVPCMVCHCKRSQPQTHLSVYPTLIDISRFPLQFEELPSDNSSTIRHPILFEKDGYFMI